MFRPGSARIRVSMPAPSPTSGKIALALGAYRFAGALARVVAPVWLARRERRGKEVAGRRGERYGRASLPRPDGPLVWFHAASVGETIAILPLVERVRALGIAPLLTTNTATSAALAAERLPAGALHQVQPLDIRRGVRRFLDHWRPDAALFAESELWPVTMGELARRDVPQLLVNARLSDRSFRRWSRRPALARVLLSHFAHVAAQSPLDAERFAALGAAPVTMTGNLKVDASRPPVDANALERLRERVADRPLWLAASLHPAEAPAIAEAAAKLRAERPDALLIAVPRHPERAPTFRAAFEAAGLTVTQRSHDEAPGGDVYLADTIGEMGLWFRLAPVAYVGKSMGGAAAGGQNPLEAAACGAAVLSGREVANFREVYRRLVAGGGAKLVPDAATLASLVAHLWAHENDRTAMTDAADGAVADMAGALERTLGVLSRHLDPLRMVASLERARAEAAERERRLAALRAPDGLPAVAALTSAVQARPIAVPGE